MRYVLPAFPFAFVWIGRVGPAIAAPSKTLVARARAFPWPHRLVAAAVCAALLWSVVSSLSVYPHSLSYFNELAGGPRNGGEHLLDSNIDWGQDLFYLKRWLDAHPATRLDGLAYFGMYPPELAGIGAKTPPSARGVQFCELGTKPDSDGPRPGWYAVSVNLIHGNVIGRWSVLPE